MRAARFVRLSSLIGLLLAAGARAEGLDRDTLLTDAAAVPEKGTVRITGGGNLQQKPQDSAAGTTGGVSGSIQWTPIANLSGDVGAYFQTGDSGPSARVRYQILKQSNAGVDLTAGVRFKTVSFRSSASSTTNNGEVEFLLAAGRSIGRFDLVLNGVFGVETGGGEGKDVEAKAFAGYRITDSLRAGLDFRVQAEVGDEEAGPALPGRDFDLTTGPALSWMVAKNIQLQALIGAAAPKRMNNTVPVGVLAASIDF